jgi:hypothetical protein
MAGSHSGLPLPGIMKKKITLLSIPGTTGGFQMRADIVPGATFPDFELTDHTRTRRRLSELQGNDPMVLVLARGHY